MVSPETRMAEPFSYPVVFNSRAKERVKDGAGSALLFYPSSGRLEISIPSRQQTFCDANIAPLYGTRDECLKSKFSRHALGATIVCNYINPKIAAPLHTDGISCRFKLVGGFGAWDVCFYSIRTQPSVNNGAALKRYDELLYEAGHLVDREPSMREYEEKLAQERGLLVEEMMTAFGIASGMPEDVLQLIAHFVSSIQRAATRVC